MGLDIEALKVFLRVAELRSFAQAARQLNMPRARASAHVQRLEGELGTALLHRTTRVVRLTPEGEDLLERARALVVDAEEIASLFRADAALRGRVRVALPALVARDLVIPHLPDLLQRHPQLHVDLCASDRLAAPMRDGFDLVLRIGPVHEPSLVGRRLGEVSTRNYASPAYLRAHGTPRTREDLQNHIVVHYAADPIPSFEYMDGAVCVELPMRASVTVDSFEAYEAAGAAGLGIVQLPDQGQARYADRLVEILPELRARPSPIQLLHTHGRSSPRRVRVVMGWLIDRLLPLVSRAT